METNKTNLSSDKITIKKQLAIFKIKKEKKKKIDSIRKKIYTLKHLKIETLKQSELNDVVKQVYLLKLHR